MLWGRSWRFYLWQAWLVGVMIYGVFRISNPDTRKTWIVALALVLLGLALLLRSGYVRSRR